MESVLVAGGAGFIGSNFVRLLLARTDARVVVLDRLTYAGNLASLADVRAHPRFAFVQGDIADRAAVEALLGEHRPDAIVNLAAETHVDRSIDGPRAFVETNLVGTFELLDAARQHLETLEPARRARFRFLHVSTDEVYGSLGPIGAVRRGEPVRPQLAVRRLEGGRRPPRAGVSRDLPAPGARHQLLEQLRALPVPGEADPAHDAQRRRGPAAAALRRRRQRARLAPRGGSLRGPAPGPAARRRRAAGTTWARGTSGRTSRSWTGSARRSSRSGRRRRTPRSAGRGLAALRGPPDVRPRPPRPRPSLRRRRDPAHDRARLAPGAPVPGRAPRHRGLVPRAPRAGARRCWPASTGGSASVWARRGPPAPERSDRPPGTAREARIRGADVL